MKVTGKSERTVWDLHDAVVIAYPGAGRSLEGRVHIFPVPRAGQPLQAGVHVEGDIALYALIAACEEALNHSPSSDATQDREGEL